ncbi:hypothetical protein VPNG_07053 [Cytospora leucostoma]|uniref:Uncharacterized protein n=1 Tax=Cytospora leucostoma TaxID=1230097 RepID=A0A423WNQ7_9PEZI|nr:hypothetical protein VPNG_07053 [Cytospora leucostoma]
MPPHRAENHGSVYDGSSLPKMLVMRGSLELQMFLLDGTGSMLYFQRVIAPDDVQAVRALVAGLDEKTMDSYYPLHMAALGG